MTFDTFTITGKGQPILIVEAGQGPTLIVHNDTDTGFVILSDDTSSVGNNPNQGFPLPSSGFLNVDGKNNVYAIGAAVNDSHTVNVVPGGLSFFQPSDTLIVAGPTSGILVYNPSQGAGNLIASLVSNIIIDKFGNVIKPEGLTVYGTNNTRIFVGIGATGSTEELFFSGLAQELQAFGIVSAPLLTGAAEFIAGALEGPQINVPGHADWVLVQLNSPNVGGTSSANGSISYVDNAGTTHQWAIWDSTGFALKQAQYVPADGNSYTPGLLSIIVPANVHIATTATVTAGPSINVKAGVTYRVRGTLIGNQLTAASVQFMGFGGVTTGGGPTQLMVKYIQEGAAQPYSTIAHQSVIGFVASPAYVAGRFFWLEIEGEFTPSADGVINIVGTCSVAADDFSIIGGSFLDFWIA